MRIDRRRMLAMTCTAPFVLHASPARAQTLDDLFSAAKTEGALTMYTGGASINSVPVVKAFNTRFPGIDVTVIGAYSNVNDVKIDRQLREHQVSADIASFQTIQDFVRWNRAGELMPFKFDGFDLYERRYKDPGGAFVATSLNPLTYAFNTDLVTPAAVPKSALDFLRPRFHGKAITCYPHDDDATLYLFYTLSQKYGWGFIEKYMATRPAFVEGHLGVARAVASGKKLVTFDCSAHMATDMKKKGQPIDVAFSAVDPTPVFYNTSAILRAAPHPNAAKLFTAWYLSREQQLKNGTWSARRDVPPPEGAQPLSSYKLANRYRDFLLDAPLVAHLRKRFLAYTGPVVNKS
jgi:ABC-type Fe3+ transport system substrate-binding protein